MVATLVDGLPVWLHREPREATGVGSDREQTQRFGVGQSDPWCLTLLLQHGMWAGTHGDHPAPPVPARLPCRPSSLRTSPRAHVVGTGL